MMTRFAVKNYKCLKDVSIPLTSLHVIIGQNDSGKTSLLEAILALHRTKEGPLLNAFPNQWEGRELVYELAKLPCVSFEASFRNSQNKLDQEIFYSISINFNQTKRSCSSTLEWLRSTKKIDISQNPIVLRKEPRSNLARPLRSYVTRDEIGRFRASAI